MFYSFLKNKFKQADANNSKLLSFPEVKTLCKRLNIVISKEEMKVAFDIANKKKETETGKEEALDEEEFVDFYYLLMRRPEIDKLFDKYADDEVIVFISSFNVFKCFF